ncbi:MAG: hypothetical protein LM589_01680 [Thermosphaera sp.]|nr:hypothetical protein [Thermosphaera sp.]
MSLIDILINPPYLVFAIATFFAFILSLVLAVYVCEGFEECSDDMATYYFFIFMLLGFSLLIVVTAPWRFPDIPSYVLVIPVFVFIVNIIIVIIHAIYALYKRGKNIERVLMLGGFFVSLCVCVIIMGSYILNLPVSQASNLPVTKTYTTTETVASLVTTITLTTTETMTQPPITYTITNIVTKTEVVTSPVPGSTLTITVKPLFSEALIALAIAVAMVVTSIAIGLKLRKK